MVAVFLADGVAEMEAVIITEALRRAGIETLTVGVTGMTVTGARGQKLTADIALSGLSDTEMPVLPGGLRGVENLAASERVRELIQKAFAADAPVGAICAAPLILGEWGFISGRTVTCHPSVAQEVRQSGAYVLDRPWVREGSLVTGRGPGASIQFACALVSMLRGDSAADKLAEELMVTWRLTFLS